MVCPECNRKFNRYASFRSHLTIHEEEDNLSCNLCEALFAQEHALNKHITEEHKEPIPFNNFPTQTFTINEQPVENEKFELKFTCKICQTKLKTLKEYQTHMDHHTKLRSMLKLKQRKKRKVQETRYEIVKLFVKIL